MNGPSPLSDEQLDRYARHIVLPEVGGAGQMKLRHARVALIGAGGIGSPAIQYLAAAGIGQLVMVDHDTVSLSNLQRQILYGTADIGRAKLDVASEVVARLTPDVGLILRPERVTTDNVARILQGADVVIDGTDNFATRLIVADECHRQRITLVSAAIARFQGQIATFRSWEADMPCYRCFVGDAHDPDDCDSCAEQGVLGAMCGMMGSFAAMEAIRQITGFGEDAAGKLHIFDGLKPALRTVRLPKDPACRTCGAA